MKKVILITGYDDNQKEIGDLTSEIMRQYAEKWEMDFWCNHAYNHKEPASWRKVELILQALEQGYTNAIWMDADVLITNFEIPPITGSSIKVSRDWGKDAHISDFSCGVMCVGMDAIHVIKKAVEIKPQFLHSKYWEQDAFRSLKYSTEASSFAIFHRRFMNAVPIQVSTDVVEPWQLGDWICHITMVPVKRKVEIFHEILNILNPKPIQQKPNVVGFRHGANIGDIIYSLWSVKKACERGGFKAIYYQWLNRPAHYYDGAEHPTKHNDKQVSVNQAMFDMIKPLIESLPFIEAFLPWNGEKSISLDRIREIQCGMPFGDIRRWYGYAYPDMQVDIGEQLFSPEYCIGKCDLSERNLIPYSELQECIIVNRTSRYRNNIVSYAFLQNVKSKIYFAGTMEEYAEFQSQVPKANYLHVQDFLDLAIYIGNCKVFIGNQSFCFSLAEAMKVPRILEVCSYAPNVIVAGPHGNDFYDQQSFEVLVGMYAESTE